MSAPHSDDAAYAAQLQSQYDAEAAGALAVERALAAAGLEPQQVDLVACASGTMDQGMPSNAALLHLELGLGQSGIPALDVNASCLGFLAAVDTLSWPLSAGRYRRILLVCSDIASCGLDWQQVEGCGRPRWRRGARSTGWPGCSQSCGKPRGWPRRSGRSWPRPLHYRRWRHWSPR